MADNFDDVVGLGIRLTFKPKLVDEDIKKLQDYIAKNHKVNIDLNLSKEAIKGLEKLGQTSVEKLKPVKEELSSIHAVVGKINKESKTIVNDVEVKRVTELNKGLGQTQKIIQDIHKSNPTIVNTNDIAKQKDFFQKQLEALNRKQQSSYGLGLRIDGLAPGTETLLKKQLDRYQSIIKEFQKLNEAGIEIQPEKLMKLQNIENRIDRFYKKIKDSQKDSHGFDFKQFEAFDKLSPAIINATNALEYFDKSILEDWKLIKAATQETEHYIKVTQQLRQGSVHKDIGVYIDKNTGQMYKFNEALRDGTTRSWGLGEAMSTAASKAMVWTTVMGSLYGVIGLLQQIPSILVDIDTRLVEMSKVMSSNTDFGTLMQDMIQSANQYGKTITEVQDSTIEFAKAGYEADKAITLANASLLGSNVTGLKTAEMADHLTGAMAQFNMTAEQSVSIVDKINEVDNQYSVTSLGLSQSIDKAGESAQQFGVTLDELLGMTTGISTATRESGKQVGNALKTMFARLNSDDAVKALESVKISTKDVSGELRSATQIYSDVATKWDTLSRAQKTYIAEALAGKFHITRFLALMDNWNIVTDATKTSQTSLFSSLEENRKHMQSLEAQINKVKAASQEFTFSLGENGLKSAISGVLGVTETFIKGLTELTKMGAAGKVVFTVLIGSVVGLTVGLASLITKVRELAVALAAFTARAMANPWILLATAIAGVITAVALYLGHQAKLREEQEKLNQTVQQSKASFNELSQAMTAVGQPTLQNINDTEAQIKRYNELTDAVQKAKDKIENEKTTAQVTMEMKLGAGMPDVNTYNANALSQEIKDLAANLRINVNEFKSWDELLAEIAKKQKELNDLMVDGKKNSTEYQAEQIKSAQNQLDLANNTLSLVQEYRELNETQKRNEEQNKRLIEVKNMLLGMFPIETANGQIVVGLLEAEARKRVELAEAHMGQTREQLIANQKSTQTAYETAVKNIALYQAEISTLKELWAARANKQAAGVGDFRMLDNLSDLEYRLDQEKGKADTLAKTLSEINNILNWKPKAVGGSSGSSKSSGSSSNNEAEKAAKELAQKQEEFLNNVVDAYKEAYAKEEEIAIASLKAQEKAAEDAHNAEIKRLDDELSKYEEVYNAKRKSLEKEESAEDYTKNLAKEQKIAQDIQNQINQRSMDDSPEGRAKKAELEKQLAEQREKIQDMQTQHDRETRKQNLEDEYNKYKDSIEAKKDAENQKYDTTKSALEKQIADTQYYYDELMNNERKYADIRQQIISGNLTKIKEELKKFADDFAKINKDKAKEIGVSFEELLNLATKVNGALNNNPYPVNSGGGSSGGGSGSSGGSGGSNSSSGSGRAKVVNVSSYLNVRESANGNAKSIGKVFPGEVVQISKTNGEWDYITYNTANGKKSGWANGKYIQRFKTGGYTGNSEGLAWLDKKEIILKEHDTTNLLKVIETTRNIITNFKSGLDNFKYQPPSVAGQGNVTISMPISIENLNGDQQGIDKFFSAIENGMLRRGIRLGN